MNRENYTEEQFLKKITEIINANVHNEKFGVTELAKKLNVSRATLHRKLQISKKKIGERINPRNQAETGKRISP
jgi:response regulator of citrate/malate metabolism